ncbi:MAG: hypothetical protein JRF33_02650 [Deltaproteobacteria bacterium]|nr:hypothetical protein [Deltaproteobacteria bacterium]
MAKAIKGKKKDKLYVIVERLRSYPKEKSRNKKFYNFRDPTALRALRIHRHLQALEKDILDTTDKSCIELSIEFNNEPKNERIVLSIRNQEMHCCRVAYLSQREFRILRKNRKVANRLRRCPAYKDVA